MLSEGVRGVVSSRISSTSSPQEIRHKDSGSKNNQIFFIENCLEIVIKIFDGCKFTKKKLIRLHLSLGNHLPTRTGQGNLPSRPAVCTATSTGLKQGKALSASPPDKMARSRQFCTASQANCTRKNFAHSPKSPNFAH